MTQTAAALKLLAVLFPFLRCIEDTELIGLADHRKYKTPRQVREIVTDRVVAPSLRLPAASSTICELAKDTSLPQVQATDGLLHRVGSHGSMPLRMGNQQRVVAKVVDVPRDTLAFQRNQIDGGWFEEWLAAIASHPESVVDIAARFFRGEGLKTAENGDALAQLRQLRLR